MAQKRRGCLAIFFPRKGVNPETVALSSAAERLPLAFPYRPRKSMLSAAELVFYNVLKTAIGARFVILLKVGVSDLCEITSREVNQAAFNRIAAKRVDFVLCDPVRRRCMAHRRPPVLECPRPGRRLLVSAHSPLLPRARARRSS